MFMETYLAHPSKHCSNLKQAETSHYSFKQNERRVEENMKKVFLHFLIYCMFSTTYVPMYCKVEILIFHMHELQMHNALLQEISQAKQM